MKLSSAINLESISSVRKQLLSHFPGGRLPSGLEI